MQNLLWLLRRIPANFGYFNICMLLIYFCMTGLIVTASEDLANSNKLMIQLVLTQKNDKKFTTKFRLIFFLILPE